MRSTIRNHLSQSCENGWFYVANDTYSYNADGLQVEKNDDGLVERYVYDGNNRQYETNDLNAVKVIPWDTIKQMTMLTPPSSQRLLNFQIAFLDSSRHYLWNKEGIRDLQFANHRGTNSFWPTIFAGCAGLNRCSLAD